MHSEQGPQEEHHPPQNTELSFQREQLGEAIAGLESLCTALPEISSERLLWFHPEEVDAVNTLWEQSGIEGVLARFGEERRYHIDSVSDLDHEPSDEDAQISFPAVQSGVPIRLLQIFEMKPREVEETQQSQYFRRASVSLDEGKEHELLEKARVAGIIDKIIPESDSASGLRLKGREIVGFQPRVEWYGAENWYGDGSVFRLGLEIQRPGDSNIWVDLNVNEQSEAFAKLLDPELYETGYEGHDHRSIDFTIAELQVLQEIVEEVIATGAREQGQSYTGAWYGNSFSE